MTRYSPNIEYTSFGTKVTLPVKEVRSVSSSSPNLWGKRELKVNYADGSEVTLSGCHDFIEVADIVVNAIIQGRRSGIVEGYDKAAHNRGLNYKYFLNRENPAAIVGRPNGTLAIQGLFGNREAFLRIFGNADNAGSGVANNVCDQFTVAIQCGTLVSCDSEDNKKFAIVNAFLLSGVIPVGISMSNSIDQNGVMYTTANASFQFTGLRIVNDSANA